MKKEEAERIKAFGRGLGFSLIGFTRAVPLEEEGHFLKEWLARGFDATMSWMGRTADKRSDPRRVLEGAKSVIATGYNYYHPISHTNAPDVGKISRYAWGEDYHTIVLKKLEAFAEWLISTHEGCTALAYVDTGPLLEKALAARAGIGWQGKHTNVISQELGSWMFLGEIITTLDLPPDEPAVDHCGTCTLCIDACPTDAIVEPYVVDSGRCLSYLTIEHRGDISGDVRNQFEQWIFGCDICQDVCPWNEKFARPSDEPRFLPRAEHKAPPLQTWSTMTPEEFKARFAGSPVRRAKWEGLMRNIRIVQEENGASSPRS